MFNKIFAEFYGNKLNLLNNGQQGNRNFTQNCKRTNILGILNTP